MGISESEQITPGHWQPQFEVQAKSSHSQQYHYDLCLRHKGFVFLLGVETLHRVGKPNLLQFSPSTSCSLAKLSSPICIDRFLHSNKLNLLLQNAAATVLGENLRCILFWRHSFIESMVVAWVDGVRKWIPVRQSWLELAGVFIAFFEQNEVALLGPGMHVMLYVVFCAVECIRKAVRHHPLQTTNSTLSLNLRALFMIRAAGCQREPILLIFFTMPSMGMAKWLAEAVAWALQHCWPETQDTLISAHRNPLP